MSRGQQRSALEAVDRAKKLVGRKISWVYNDRERNGGHICCVIDVWRLKAHHPSWSLTRGLASVLQELIKAQMILSARKA